MKIPKRYLISFLCFLLLAILLQTRSITLPFLYRYKQGYWYTLGTIRTDNPLKIDSLQIKTIPWSSFQFHPEVRFMADPFVVKDKDTYYIFFEHFPAKMNSSFGDIGVLASKDLIKWEHLGIVLDEPFHLSYPNVFQYKDKWYMLPETTGANQVRLYFTDHFPYDWKLHTVIINNRNIDDATLLIKDDAFYIYGKLNNKLILYYSKDLFAGWQEHPCSPLRDYDIRPGGRPEILNEQLVYFIQDNSHGYGTGLIGYAIDSISPNYFKDHKLENNPILYRFGTTWASAGMHHLTWIKLPEGDYFCVMDGAQKHSTQWGWDWKNFPHIQLKF